MRMTAHGDGKRSDYTRFGVGRGNLPEEPKASREVICKKTLLKWRSITHAPKIDTHIKFIANEKARQTARSVVNYGDDGPR